MPKVNSKEWLEKNGYDGLYCPGECGCLVTDLAPCECSDEEREECEPGYKIVPTGGASCDNCDIYGGFCVGGKSFECAMSN